jgi:hypothetical protein
MAIETLPNRMKGKAPTWKGEGKGKGNKKERTNIEPRDSTHHHKNTNWGCKSVA